MLIRASNFATDTSVIHNMEWNSNIAVCPDQHWRYKVIYNCLCILMIQELKPHCFHLRNTAAS